MRRIRKDDMVKIIAGKDSGRQGKVLSFDPESNKVVVEGCNMVTKHQKPGANNAQGGIVKKEAALDASNVMLLVDGQPTRVGFRIENGRKVRVAKRTGTVRD